MISFVVAGSTTSHLLQPSIEHSLSNHCNNITCRKGFFCREGDNTTADMCLPLCNEWKLNSDSVSLAVDVLQILSAAIGLASSIVFLIIAVIRREKMYVYMQVTFSD